MKKVDPTDVKPCAHMRVLVSAHVDSMLPGVAEWYTQWHIKGCKQCQASLPFLHSLKDRLNVLEEHGEYSSLTPDRRKALESKLEEIDSTQF